MKVVVSSCGFTSLLKDDLPSWTGPRYMPRIASQFGNDVARMPFDFPEILASIAPRPLLVCAAPGDNDIDIGGVRDMIALRSAGLFNARYAAAFANGVSGLTP